ncbi:ubiquitin-conjugating enzyme E2 G2 [Enteropsectra breve]|nr:ubiquitin-conjugating enzyme E2 G2 [Enteropsectra breve]
MSGNTPKNKNDPKQKGVSPSTENLMPCAIKRLLKEYEMVRDETAMGEFKLAFRFAKGEDGAEKLNEWDVYIPGPPGTIYEGYILHAKLNFPSKYPFMPPTFKFITPMWHPNIYTSGVVCISILQNESDDPSGFMNSKYTWTPGQNIGSVCKSIISMLSEYNIESPANIDASNMWRDQREKYYEKVKEILEKNKIEIPSASE